MEIPIVDCELVGPHDTYMFSVRAVNYAPDGHHYGPWSEPDRGNCFNTGLT